jgi:hypothetical protein
MDKGDDKSLELASKQVGDHLEIESGGPEKLFA